MDARAATLALAAAACGAGDDSGFAGGGGGLWTGAVETGGETASGVETGGETASGVETGVPEPLQEACATGEEGEPELLPAVRAVSSVTWTLDFDADAEATGLADCTYARDWAGTQVLDSEFLCPDCEFIARGTATMTSGADCYAAVFGAVEEERTELWGVGGGVLHRSGRDQYPLGDLAEIAESSGDGTPVPVSWSASYELDSGGTMTLSASGTLAWWTDPDTLVEEPFGPRAEPYACGWECEDPGTLALDYELEPGDVLPNVRLEDQCGDLLDLWDLYGSWLVVEASVPDCGPCRTMAEGEEEFVAEMRRAGIPVRVVTLLGAELAEPWATPDAATRDAWVEAYDLTDPVLRDRGYAHALFPGLVDRVSGEDYGFPTWVIVDPEMRIVTAHVGFSSWDAIAAVVEQAAARR